jgi:hypothetical protein
LTTFFSQRRTIKNRHVEEGEEEEGGEEGEGEGRRRTATTGTMNGNEFDTEEKSQPSPWIESWCYLVTS